MSFFNPKVPLKEKPVSHHPWERYIKDTYISTYKYGHNSAKNPVYPPKKEKLPSADRVKFTVIGNRIAKEFIYCMKLVKGLYKYKWKHFDAPIIRGVTGVEWPKIWNDLKIQYGGLAYCLQSQCAILINDRFLGGEEELKTLIQSKYVYHLCPDYYKEGIKLFANYLKSSGRPCAYLQISINKVVIGSMIFMLYSDIVPDTCENFLRLCKTNKGGYSGTPVHRIVKDCWIQCGGFGIKDTKMQCENFIVPHDRRGVIGMANAGRHMDCSTQFFVLLQPAKWMANRYVAFGQLIDGEETLQKIENVSTWYETPTESVTIFKAGVFNMECQDIMINRGTNKYIQGHIENLFAIGELFYEAILEKVFLETDFRSLQRIQDEMLGEGAEVTPEEAAKNLRTTERFMRKKEEIDRQLEKPEKVQGGVATPVVENNEFDVEVYEYEPEEYSYKHVSVAASASVVVNPEKPFYIPLTDVPYPGEVDSTYDLKKVLRGDYCLEVDLDKNINKKNKEEEKLSFPVELLDMLFGKTPSTESEDSASLDSADEKEIKKYLKFNADHVSFAGDIIKTVAKKDRVDLFEKTKKPELLSDDELRRFRLACDEYRAHRDKKVSISVPNAISDTHKEIIRRQTGFVHPEDVARIKQFQREEDGDDDEDDDEDDDDGFEPIFRPTQIAPPPAADKTSKYSQIKPHQTGFVRPDDLEKEKTHITSKTSPQVLLDEEEGKRPVRIKPPHAAFASDGARNDHRPTGIARTGNLHIFDDDDDEDDDHTDIRPSVLHRLYESLTHEDIGPGPTLKDYRPFEETRKNNSLFLTCQLRRLDSDDDDKGKFMRRSLSVDRFEQSIDRVLELQHGRKVGRKISSDYVKTIDHIENKRPNSIRSIEYARTRPAISVVDYQKKNQEYYQEQLKKGPLLPDTKPPAASLRFNGQTALI